MWVYFEAYKTYISKPSMKYGKMEKKWEKKNSVSEEKVLLQN